MWAKPIVKDGLASIALLEIPTKTAKTAVLVPLAGPWGPKMAKITKLKHWYVL